MSRTRHLCLCLGLLVTAGLSAAEPTDAPRVHLVLAEAGGPYRSVARSLESAWRAAGAPALELSTALAADTPPALPARTLVIAIGVEAARVALAAHPASPVHATLVPRSTWARLSAEAPPRSAPSSVAWLDQPEARVLALARLIAPRARAAGLVLGPASAGRAEDLRVAAGRRGIGIELETVADSLDPTHALSRLLPRVQVVVAVPDPLVWNRATVEPLVLATFRARRPLIGVTPALLAAGAVAVLHTTPEQFGTELAERLRAQGGVRLPPSSAPRRFRVDTNPEVGRSLGLNLPPAAELTVLLRAAEAQP